ncbi:flavodoxin family protein [Methanoregula sp.]|uniref:flavodoxin family protein n=1 Tax=Methanoregula sp. TaxID=2052170 RepID=UPI003BAF0A70
MNKTPAEPVRELLQSKVIGTGKGGFTLTLYREDFSALYPGMVRFVLEVMSEGRTLDAFRTNTYEYSPLVPLAAENVALRKADEWARELATSPDAFLSGHHRTLPQRTGAPASDVVIIQGSPRPDGNCGILASWAVEAAQTAGRTARVIYPHDLDIHFCTGCYQCYNTGTCVFDDDMTGIIDELRGASLLVVCSPVYTNTVPGGLKLLIDRTQAYHAERVLSGGRTGQTGLVFSVAGRRGGSNFACVTRVLSAFFENLGIRPAGQLTIDSTDAIRDIRSRESVEHQAKDLVRQCLR